MTPKRAHADYLDDILDAVDKAAVPSEIFTGLISPPTDVQAALRSMHNVRPALGWTLR